MTTTITRLSDAVVLTYSSATGFQPPAELFGTSFEKGFYSAPHGESILVSNAVDAKTFNLIFPSGDATGSDQQAILDFFSRGRWFSLTDTELGLTDFEFTVLAPAGDFSAPAITCQARFGLEPQLALTTISSQSMAAGDSSTAVSTSFTNLEDHNASIRLTITAESTTSWDPLVGGVLEAGEGYVSFSMSKLSDVTSNPVNWRGKRFILDSDREVIEGYGLISGISWKPFVVEPGETVTVELTAIDNPFVSTSIPWTLLLEAVVFEEVE